jgi:cell division septum initiation protein DivIVA
MTDGPTMPAVSEVHDDPATASEDFPREHQHELDKESVSASPDVQSQLPELIRYEYEPLLRSLDADCRRIVATAHSEAEAIRNDAREESRRRISSAHREEAKILSRAADQQVVIYRDTQNEVDRRLDELEQERAAVLAAARAEADDIVARAHDEAGNAGGTPTTKHHDERLSLGASDAGDLDELFEGLGQSRRFPEGPDDRSGVDTPAPGEAQPLESAPRASGLGPVPTVRRHQRRHWWSRKG